MNHNALTPAEKKMNSKPKEFHDPGPSKEYSKERAYMDYVRDGDQFFKEGLTFEQYHEQKQRLIEWFQESQKNKPAHFHNMRVTKFDGYHDR